MKEMQGRRRKREGALEVGGRGGGGREEEQEKERERERKIERERGVKETGAGQGWRDI